MLGLLAIGLFTFGVVLSCPTGYTNDGGNCYKLFNTRLTRFQALRTCQKDGAILYPVPNQIENTRLWTFSNELGDIVWVGVTCVGTDVTSCINDEGSPNPFSNFLTPVNDATGGACAILRSQNGNWFSVSCAAYTASFVCKYTNNYNVQRCDSGSWLFNGHCYSLQPTQYPTMEEEACANLDGHAASIHTVGENNFIFDVAYNSLSDSSPFFRIGLFTPYNGVNKWTDGSLYDYTNWGIVDNKQCTDVSLDGRVIARGKWIASDCNTFSPVICKKQAISPGPPVTRVSTLCTQGAVMQTNGSFWSPNYPYSYLNENCENLITWNNQYPTETLYIQFPELYIGPNDKINIYSHVTSSQPDATLTYQSNPMTVYSYSGGQVKLEFVGDNANRLAYRWRGYTTLTRTGIDTEYSRGVRCAADTALSDRGEFQTANYPYSYQGPCTIKLSARTAKNTVVVNFFDFYMGPNDVVIFFDGPDSNSSKLNQVTGAQPGLAVESSGPFMFIEVKAANTSANRGIWGKFYSN